MVGYGSRSASASAEAGRYLTANADAAPGDRIAGDGLRRGISVNSDRSADTSGGVTCACSSYKIGGGAAGRNIDA